MTQRLRPGWSIVSYSITASLISAVAFCSGAAAKSESKPASEVPKIGDKHVIGATATVEEVRSDLLFKARVDTGATTSSLHIEEYIIEDEAERMEDNVGKKIRFRMKNQDGESEWLKSRIAEVSLIQTSVDAEHRYKVLLTLQLYEVKKKVLVTLKDRSHMKYPMLLGRNFLRGDFIVDVEGRRANRKSVETPAPKQAAPKRSTSDEQKSGDAKAQPAIPTPRK